MRILVACECSGRVRDAFRSHGHDAFSCDLKACEVAGPHFQCDVFEIIDDGWDMMIAFPECTHLCVSGAKWFSQKRKDGRQQEAIDFFMRIANAKIDRICIENPVGIMSTIYRKPCQIVQPWQFGHGETKKTCLWLKNLPVLIPTEIVEGREARIHQMAPGPNRKADRSRTYTGIASAMGSQRGNL